MSEQDGRREVPAAAAEAPPQRTGTGDARVDDALTRLAELDDAPVHDHPAVIEDIHRVLQDTLAEDED